MHGTMPQWQQGATKGVSFSVAAMIGVERATQPTSVLLCGHSRVPPPVQILAPTSRCLQRSRPVASLRNAYAT